jgi:sterol desaturase/sphingolipid hydroxylase (fatty acid hydroxylase superfamily)
MRAAADCRELVGAEVEALAAMEQMVQFLQGKTGTVLVCFAGIFVLERLFPAARPRWEAAVDRAVKPFVRLGKNLGLAGINAALSPLVVIPISAVAAQWSLDWRPPWLGGMSGLAFDLLLLDFWIYWWHRANHRVPVLWRFHEVHHLDQFLDVTSAIRFHLGEVMLSAVVRAALVFLVAIPLSSVLIFETTLVVATMFHHSNLKLPAGVERLLSYLIVTPSIHWVHHHALRSDTDSNYSTILSVWDRLFASRSATRRTLDLKIGVEREQDRPFLALILRPFKDRA